MKKPFLCLILLVCLLLSGCACQHEWTDADCLNPQVCTKCEETAGEALGHDWAAATCIDPETCTRCSETRGNKLDHTFGSWKIIETEMTHTCEICGYIESSELTQEVHLDMLLQGYWEISALVNVEQKEYYAASVFDEIIGEYLQFSEGQNLTGKLNQEVFTGTWEFYQFDEVEGNDIYIFQAFDESGRDLEMHLTCTESKDILSIFFANGTRIIMERYDDIAAQITGIWASEKNTDGTYTLDFHEDHTVSCKLAEEFEGTWHLTPVQDLGSISYYGLYIVWSENGERMCIDGSILLSNPDAPPYGISLNWNKDGIRGVSTGFRKG